MFQSLQTRLTVLYAALFGAALIVVSLVVYGAVATNAKRAVQAELQAGGTVFDRLWSLRASQLHEGAALLARDFGFRAAMADGDAATIASAVDNLRQRLGVDRAFVIAADGRVVAGDPVAAQPVADALMRDEEASGVAMIGGAPYQAISAPILSPDLAGWVVFASRLDQAEMTSLARLSAIPLDAAVLHKASGQWLTAQPAPPRERLAVTRFVEANLAPGPARPNQLRGAGAAAVALVKPLRLMDSRSPAVLMLRYPLERALAPYRPMLLVIVGAGLAGLALLAWGSWRLARTITRPIAALAAAARRLRDGEHVEVAVATHDEVGELAESFNAMAAAIRERERRITELATHDAETKLPNRLALERALAQAMRSDRAVVVAALGLDRFAHVRGAIGYGLSSAIVGEVGRRLARLAPAATVARISTDCLGACLIAEPAEAEALIAGVREALERPVEVGGSTVDLALTVGLTAWPKDAETPAALVDRANIALDQARQAGRRHAWFDEALYGDPAANLSLMSEMLQAIGAGALCVHYQPKFDLRRRAITGLEALVRWPHPVRGALPPDLFVGMAEETGHIRALTDHVLARALADQQTLLDQGHDLAVSVNLSGRLLADEDFAEAALRLATRHPGRLCLEVTETAVIDDPARALAQLDRYAAAGVEISIDDYGAGLSSLAYLKRIRASELKIDKAFVLGMASSARDALLVRSTVDLAHGLGMKVTAEGVEDAAALALLSGMGCDFAQGYFVARPMPLKDLLRFLEDSRQLIRLTGAQGEARDEDLSLGARRGRARRAGAGRA